MGGEGTGIRRVGAMEKEGEMNHEKEEEGNKVKSLAGADAGVEAEESPDVGIEQGTHKKEKRLLYLDRVANEMLHAWGNKD